MADTVFLGTRALREARNDFRDYCRRRGTTVARIFRKWMGEALEEDKIGTAVAPSSTGRGRLRIELRLLPNEGRLVDKLVKEDGLATPQEWFISRVHDAAMSREGRFVGTQEARHISEEIERVMRSLLGMATNLNQVARALNSNRATGQKLPPERLVVLASIEKDLMGFVHRAHAVLDKLDNPRGPKPLPKKNPEPITPKLCKQIRQALEAVIREKSGTGS